MNSNEHDSRRAYLFLLSQPSTAVRRETASRMRGLGLTIVAQHDAVALEALATPGQARAAQNLGVFSAVLKGPMSAEHLERLDPSVEAVVRQWNVRFGDSYRALKRDRSQHERSWADPALSPPGPHSMIAAEDFRQFVEQYERRTGQSPWRPAPDEPGGADQEDATRSQSPDAPEPRDPQQIPGVLPADEFSRYEQRLSEIYGDPTVGYHLARLAMTMGRDYYRQFERLSPEFLSALWAAYFPEADCWEMTGEIAVGVVFVESSREGGPTFSDERDDIYQEILDGFTWLAAQHPGSELSWIFDRQLITIDVDDGDASEANCPGLDTLEASWRDPAMANVVYQGNTYPGAWNSVADYREDMRVANSAAHSLVIFVTPYANCWHAYAGGSRIVLAQHNDWGGWGRQTLDAITAHEVCHLFGAADEYTGKGTPCRTCDTVHGCDRIPNGNCGTCARPHQSCVMGGNDRRLCAYSRGQIGWSHLFVELTTADELWASTDDTVTLDIGDRTFNLDTADHDDRERNNREGYALWAPGLTRHDLKRVLIRKAEDSIGGGWKLDGVRVWVEGQLFCDQSGIDKWLEDDDRTWLGCVTSSDLICELSVEITTADVRWAGTDDDVSITLAGRTWNLDNAWHNDFERGNTDTFTLDAGTGLYRSDLHALEIRKSPDGFSGGWKLEALKLSVDGDPLVNVHIDKWLEDDDRTWSMTF